MTPLISSILYSLFVERRNENWCFSPASYLEAMGSLSVCLKGDNLKELLEAAPDVVESNSTGLESTNVLLHSAEYKAVLNEAVVAILASRGANLESFDGGLEAVAKVNKIVNDKTHGKISQLLTAEDITELTKFIILNCVYFKAKWRHNFIKQSYLSEFKGTSKTTETYLLNVQNYFGYHEHEKADIVELPYKDSNLACYILVPRQSLFDVFSDIRGIIGSLSKVTFRQEINLTVPEFKTASTFSDLTKETSAAGVKKISEFNQDWALIDWDKVLPETKLRLEKIVQKTTLDFTQFGTEATGATAGIIGITGCCNPRDYFPPQPKYIRADKPFMYVLADRSDFKPLFVGAVNDLPDSVPV